MVKNKKVTVMRVMPSAGTNIWWVTYLHVGHTHSGQITVQADCELTAVLAFKRWVADSNYGWEVVSDE